MGAVCFAYERGALLQSLNSYSYANDNPITKSDPTGKCAEDGCVVETLASVGFLAGVTGQYVGDVMENHSSGVTGLAAYSPRSSAAQYVTAGVTGSAGAVAGAYSLAAAAVIGAGGYAADRQLAGKPFSLGGTVSVGALSWIGGNFFEWGVGKVPASLWLKKLISGTAFDTASQAILQSSLNGAGAMSVPSTRSQSLPATVIQNGTTYYRNSSGLLSSSPSAGGAAPNAHSACGTLCK
jgi:hypothetical protein